ncbi:hypothetical protein H924_11420 [Corynebacterium callunae DSM 20147]|uniref:Uncharacterized protein n=1 Tax=Corynebacterium callunae DSM 20147 TaxID=1121353 RepID=M1UVV7_9CORY|nr:hypothetical protein H924_11420 [Corynebacterium callunae DSM 20147]
MDPDYLYEDRASGKQEDRLESARACGRKGGRPFKMTAAKVRLTMASMRQPEISVAAFARSWGLPERFSTGMSHRQESCAKTVGNCSLAADHQ